MRAKRSWPRSSVPKGWAAEGPWRRVLKSISLMGTPHSQGPTSTARTMTARMIAPANASLCRRKRRHASAPSRARGLSGAPPISASAVADAGIEPAIEDVGEEVEEDHEAGEHERHRHDDRRVVREDRADQERADPGHAENLFGDDRAAEDRRHLERDECHHGDERVPERV